MGSIPLLVMGNAGGTAGSPLFLLRVLRGALLVGDRVLSAIARRGGLLGVLGAELFGCDLLECVLLDLSAVRLGLLGETSALCVGC